MCSSDLSGVPAVSLLEKIPGLYHAGLDNYPGIVDTPGQRVYNHSVGQDGCPMGSSKDVAKAIIYLLADSPAVMTGQSVDLFTTV